MNRAKAFDGKRCNTFPLKCLQCFLKSVLITTFCIAESAMPSHCSNACNAFPFELQVENSMESSIEISMKLNRDANEAQ